MAELKIKADSGGGTVSLKGPATTTGDNPIQLTLPVDDGTADQYLKTDGSGALSWATVASVGGATALSLNDGVKVNFGADNDLRIEGGSGNSVIQHQDTGAGDLYIDAQNSNVYIRSGDGGTNEENAIVCENNSKVKLYHSGTHVAETSANGLAFPDGKGIDFSATSDGTTMSSELLDDYEEGKFDATFANSVTAQDGIRSMEYTRIGRQVTVTGEFRIDSDNSDSDLNLNNLPFASTSADDSGSMAASACVTHDHDFAHGQAMYAYIMEGSAAIRFVELQDNGGYQNANADSGAYYCVSITYFTS